MIGYRKPTQEYNEMGHEVFRIYPRTPIKEIILQRQKIYKPRSSHSELIIKPYTTPNRLISK